MSRKIMVEVSEEELKELDKTKTLDDVVEELLNYLDAHNCIKSNIGYDDISCRQKLTKFYETPNREVLFNIDNYGVIDIRIERKPNEVRLKKNE